MVASSSEVRADHASLWWNGFEKSVFHATRQVKKIPIYMRTLLFLASMAYSAGFAFGCIKRNGCVWSYINPCSLASTRNFHTKGICITDSWGAFKLALTATIKDGHDHLAEGLVPPATMHSWSCGVLIVRVRTMAGSRDLYAGVCRPVGILQRTSGWWRRLCYGKIVKWRRCESCGRIWNRYDTDKNQVSMLRPLWVQFTTTKMGTV